MNPTYVCVGYGVVAAIHLRKFHRIGVRLGAVVDADPRKRDQAAKDGLVAVASCAEAAGTAPMFWDVCVDTAQHVQVIREILSVDPAARVLVEKPVCSPSEIALLMSLPGERRRRVVVNENYQSSTVTSVVKTTAFDKLGLRPRRISVEMTKDRRPDIAHGRFTDRDLGVLGYEGTHMLAVMQGLGKECLAEHIVGAAFTDAQGRPDPHAGASQGSALVRCALPSGAAVELYTSMVGAVRHPNPLIGIRGGAVSLDRASRHRLVAVEGTDRHGLECAVVGVFEPIAGMARGEGAVVTIRNGRVVDIVTPVFDDTMDTHLRLAMQFFAGYAQNPCTIETAVQSVQFLSSAMRKGTSGWAS